jgi:hypothetical protein
MTSPRLTSSLYPAALCFDIHLSRDLWKMMFLEMLHWSARFHEPARASGGLSAD